MIVPILLIASVEWCARYFSKLKMSALCDCRPDIQPGAPRETAETYKAEGEGDGAKRLKNGKDGSSWRGFMCLAK